MNFKLKIDLTKLRNVSIKEDAEKGKVIMIPVSDNDIFLSERGAAYLQLSIRQMKEEKYGNTHFAKQILSKNTYKSLSDEERSNLPICGQLGPDEKGANQKHEGYGESNNRTSFVSSDDMPF